MELDQAGGLRKLETFGVAVVDRREVGCGSDEEHRWTDPNNRPCKRYWVRIHSVNIASTCNSP